MKSGSNPLKYKCLFPGSLFKSIFPVIFLQLAAILAFGQDTPDSDIKRIADSVQSYNSSRALEKLYLHVDKPSYLSSDTIWFKAYLLNASNHVHSSRSRLIYLELANDSNKVVMRKMVPVTTGIGWGDIPLNDKDFPEGSYVLRAFTNWMRNAGTDYFFQVPLTINNPRRESWVVGASVNNLNNEGNVGLSLKFSGVDQTAIGLRPLRIRVTDGNRVLFRGDKETSLYGELDINFATPANTRTNVFQIVAEDLRRGEGNRKISIPLVVDHAGTLDIQFMPEGGSLVTGLISDVAFKAIAADGRGIDVSGKILDSKFREITTFSSEHRGMGKFSLKPEPGEKYIARVDFYGTSRDFNLPSVKASGVVVKAVQNNRSVNFTFQCTPDLLTGENMYHLIGQTNEAVQYAVSILLKQSVARLSIDRDLFPSGISRFTLMDSGNKPVLERRVFIDHKEVIDVTLEPSRTSYQTRDSVSLTIDTKDRTGRPLIGSFSLAVTDDSQVAKDSVLSDNILSRMFLTSGIKGNVEAPGYYFFSPDTLAASAALDLVMLTQGWVNYSWQNIFASKKPPLFPAEPEFAVSGKVTNVFNKPVANGSIVLLSKKPFIVADTITDNNGRFRFTGLPLADSMVYVIQSRNRRGNSFNVGISVDEFIPIVYQPLQFNHTPWFINTDTTFLKSTRELIKERHRYDAPRGVNVLDEVVVTAKKIVKESKNKNGSGNADFVLDEADMIAAKRLTLLQVLEKRFGYIRKVQQIRKVPEEADTMKYIMLNMYINLVIDGVDIKEIGAQVDLYMDYLTAEDITGIEVMNSAKHALSYDPYFITKQAMRKGPADMYIEITTRSGNGAFLKKTPGVYLYRPVAYQAPHEFYRPRYLVKDPNPPLADLRSTIHWEPNIVTGEDGRTVVSFYTADRPGTYSIILEGSNMNGLIGYKRAKLIVR